MKKILLSAAVLLAVPGFALAGTFKITGDSPSASITIPDSWSPKEVDGGVDATSNDGGFYIAAEITDAKDTKDAVAQDIDFLVKSGVTIDPATVKQSDGKLNGLDAADVGWDGKDKDGPTHVGLLIIGIKPGKLLLVTHWGTAESEAKNDKELTAILASIKPEQSFFRDLGRRALRDSEVNDPLSSFCHSGHRRRPGTQEHPGSRKRLHIGVLSGIRVVLGSESPSAPGTTEIAAAMAPLRTSASGPLT